MNTILNLSRRDFLKASGGLALGFHLPQALAQAGPGKAVSAEPAGAFAPNAFIRIAPDNTVTVIVKHVEMGQGTYTGLPTLVAEELDADWSQIRAEGAPADAKQYNNLSWGEVQGTGGSSAIANSYEQLRRPAPRGAPCWSPRPPRDGRCRRQRSASAVEPYPRRAGRQPSASSPPTPRSNPCRLR
jgi:CO/xanthine dehydrogenase Mo-binding subunit